MTAFVFVCLGLVVHTIFLISIFDIYFKSPILKGVSPELNEILPPGKRVVLISVDGLRLDALFYTDAITGQYIAEYLQNIIKSRGSWGISESHVPTESRPGHVAMLAGFYEDPSSVTKGWKENAVDFDSIFNRSYCSFGWGSSDILNIFFKDLKHDCTFVKSYQNEQNFAGDARVYDNWVFEKLKEFITVSNTSKRLHEEGIFFFLHLLGQDTSGHTDKPHSKKYLQNLKNVDDLVEKIENLFNEYYGDDKTTFILTSDHGMTDWGSHGAGDPEEINTPVVAWGAGIRKASVPPKQIKMSQVDITPLVAVLLGASIPVNSVGTLPIAFLNMSRKQIAEAAALNAKQVVAQYLKALQINKNQTLSFFHKPFQKLSDIDINFKLSLIKEAIDSAKYSEAITESKVLIKESLEGLDYYWNYYQRPLLISISLSYFGWIGYLLFSLLEENQIHCFKSNINSGILEAVFFCIVFASFFLIAIQRLPLLFYSYVILPEFLWYSVIKKGFALFKKMKKFKKSRYIYSTVYIGVGLELLVASFFKRWCMCISITVILLWSFLHMQSEIAKTLRYGWLISGTALGLFSLLPAVGRQPNPILVVSSGCGLCLLSFGTVPVMSQSNLWFFCLRICAIFLSTLNNYAVHNYFIENQKLLEFNQYLSWVLLVLSCGLLIMNDTDIHVRLIQIFLSLSIPFVLLSIAHEVLFFIFLVVHMLCWIFIEIASKEQKTTFYEIRISYFFLTYVFLSFFGLGNISSLNSFDPAWVRCFITIFSPFLMAALILLKTVIPFLVVTCTMRTIAFMRGIQSRKLFVIILIYCNVMALNFLFLIKNEGSWLEIGISISHYVIQQLTIVFLLVLFGFSNILFKFSVRHKFNYELETARQFTRNANTLNNLLPIFDGSPKINKFK